MRRPDPAAPSAMPIDSYDSDAEGADELARGAEIRLRWDVSIELYRNWGVEVSGAEGGAGGVGASGAEGLGGKILCKGKKRG